MYSKERGYTQEPPPTPRRPMYRQPNRPHMQVPPNYNGHAIVDGEERPLGHVEEEEFVTDLPAPDGPTPCFDDLPRISELPRGNEPLRESGDTRRRPTVMSAPYAMEGMPQEDYENDTLADESALGAGEAKEEAESAEDASIAATAQPTALPRPRGLFDLAHFPFGHGIGWEELLIIGLIWFLLRESTACEERGDLDETVILLGLLLLLG